MAKVLMLANDETTIYNFRREIVAAFVKAQHEVVIAYPYGNHTKEIEQLGCRTIDSKISRHGTNIVEDLKLFFNYLQMLKSEKPDIVLTYTVKPNIYGSLACQCRRVPYLNNITGLGTVLQSESIVSKLILFLQKLAYRKSTCIFFQNQDNCEQLKQKRVINSKHKIQILPGSGVNLSLHKFEEFPANDDVVCLIFVSRIRADKGIEELFAAAEKIKKIFSQTEFHVVGWYEEKKYEERVQQLVEDGVIIYHGTKTQEEVHQLIKGSHCLIHPSYHEGMSNVLLEASAAGRPVIASDIPGCKETFDEGKSGYGFEVKNTEELIKAITKFIQLPYEEKRQMGLHGRKKMEAEFDRNIVAQKYLDIIEKL